MKKINSSLIIFLLVLALPSFSMSSVFALPVSPPIIEWSKAFPGAGSYASTFSLVKTSDEGYSMAYSTPGPAFCLLKIESYGNLLWNKTYGNPGDTVLWGKAQSVVLTNDGGFAIAGYLDTNWSPTPGFWLVKTDSVGNEMWNRTYYGGGGYDQANCLLQISDGGYLLAGMNSIGNNGQTGWIIKTDSSGQMIWNRTYSIGEIYAITKTSDGGYAFTGSSFYLTKIDAAGSVQWSAKLYTGQTGSNEAHSLIQTNDGGYALAGWKYIDGSLNTQFWLIKTDSLGNKNWDKLYGTDGGANSVIQTSDGGYALVGGTGTYGTVGSVYLLVKTDSTGNLEWDQTFTGRGIAVASSIVQTADMGYLLAGGSSETASYQSNLFLVKTTPEQSTVTPYAYSSLNPLVTAADSTQNTPTFTPNLTVRPSVPELALPSFVIVILVASILFGAFRKRNFNT